MTRFVGDTKAPMRSPFAKAERRLIDSIVPKVPSWIQTQHLTMLTVLWTIGMIACGWAAATVSIHWLWGSSLLLALQWFTDCLDGSVGRYQNAGLKRWGYYMDHLLDYFFMTSIFIGYMFLGEPSSMIWLAVMAMIYGGMMVSSWLAAHSLESFKITFMGVGPTEIRLAFIVINTAMIFAGTTWFFTALPWAALAGFLGLFVIVRGTQSRIWKLDMEIKATEDSANESTKKSTSEASK